MGIHYNPAAQTFHLQGRGTSYVMGLVRSAYLAHIHWGARIRGTNAEGLLALRRRCSFSPSTVPEDLDLSLDTIPQEFPGFGSSDFREPAYQVRLADGTTVAELTYESHRIFNGKKPLEGLPSTYAQEEAEAETLEIDLVDKHVGLRATLSYTLFRDYDAIARSVRYVNEGTSPMSLVRAMSMGIDMPRDGFDALHLRGAWARERYPERRPVTTGGTTIESRRGASGHSLNPFIALMDKRADEDRGEVFGFSLVYSGSFAAHAEADPYGHTRLVMGINPFDFEWRLEPGESFSSPEVVLAYSAEGLGGMSRIYHKLYRNRLCRGSHRDQERPVLVNNWEATYFQFDEGTIEELASAGAELGAELFVLDDGWFGRRDDSRSSLGDWFVDSRKLPNGLADLVDRVNRLGLRFGLWFEPEMVSPDSELYRAHPDWCLHVPGRRRTEARSQLVLDFSRRDVREYVTESIGAILASSPIDYVKWDMNRNMTEIGSALLPPERQRETAHRYMLGLYEVLERLTSRFPRILFESCSGGGGRFDPGMLHYMPQTWTSDNTDAVERLKIQYGTSLVYPAITMGAHVSAVPNHQVHRTTSFGFRGHAAMSGNFGYELNLGALSEGEKDEARRQIRVYKQLRRVVQFGDHYRLRSPFEGNEAAWIFVSEDRKEALVAYFRIMAEPNDPLRKLRLKGLDGQTDYLVDDPELPESGGETFGGDELMSAGLRLPVWKGDYRSRLYRLTATHID